MSKEYTIQCEKSTILVITPHSNKIKWMTNSNREEKQIGFGMISPPLAILCVLLYYMHNMIVVLKSLCEAKNLFFFACETTDDGDEEEDE